MSELTIEGLLFYAFWGFVVLLVCATVEAILERFGKDEGQG